MKDEQVSQDPVDPDAARILVVDDNQDAGETLVQLLSANGFAVRHVADGNNALRAVSDFSPDLAILDIGLPDMDGYSLAGRLRALPDNSRLPLVALSGYGEGTDVAHARDAGFDRHLTKPVRIAELIGVINTLLARSAD